MTSTTASPDLYPALVTLRDTLRQAPLDLDVPDATADRRARTEMVDQLDDYVIPRVVQVDAPLLAVVGGSTGAGKSTLVNSLVGRPVSRAGVLRPTTRSPVLVHHPDDAHWFGPDRILPDLARTSAPSTDVGALHLVASPAMPAGLALLDAPDVDSVERANRTLATQLLAAADLWLFTTSAARYADQVPWGFLQTAAERSAAVAIVLDRTAPAAVAEIRAHLQQMLADHGLSDARLFAVPESPVDADGLLPREVVAEIRAWLGDIASDATARADIIQQTLSGALRQLAHRGAELADAVEEQERTTEQLRGDVIEAYAQAVTEVGRSTGDGTLLRGEVLARWQEFVGTGEWMRSLQAQVGRLRDRIAAAVTGRPAPGEDLKVALESSVEQLLRAQADTAAERTVTTWRALPGGPGLLGNRTRELETVGAAFPERAADEVRDWQGYVLDLVRSEGADKRTTARFLSLGVNGAGLVVMVAVFAHTGGLTGGEVAVAGGTTALGQRLLEA
ncbi:MAG: dynamin family protein, partial [Actinomycetota bacterium]|nr:dynamin family protein [Actinomycetota bacterium]